MQLRIHAALIIFIGSYLPLSMILLVRDIRFQQLSENFCIPFRNEACEIPLDTPYLSVSAFLICLSCFIFTLACISSTKPKNEIIIHECRHIPADIIGYTLPYVVSFINISYSNPAEFSGFLIFFIWMFVISYMSGTIILNPVLVAFGWRFYEVVYEFAGGSGKLTGNLLAKGSIENDERHRYAEIQSIKIVRKTDAPEK